MADTPPPVEHDAESQRFSVTLDGPGEVGYVHYAPTPSAQPETTDGADSTPHLVRFDYIFVPPAARGSGLNHRLLHAAFDHARAAGWTVEATCPYIRQSWLPRHPEYHDLLA